MICATNTISIFRDRCEIEIILHDVKWCWVKLNWVHNFKKKWIFYSLCNFVCRENKIIYNLFFFLLFCYFKEIQSNTFSYLSPRGRKSIRKMNKKCMPARSLFRTRKKHSLTDSHMLHQKRQKNKKRREKTIKRITIYKYIQWLKSLLYWLHYSLWDHFFCA